MSEQPFGLPKLPEFIGRQAILEEIEQWLKDEKCHVMFLAGEYGIGKTRLLQQLVELTNGPWEFGGAPTQLIDLYHYPHHTQEGLAQAIVHSFKKTGQEGYFNFYYRAQEGLQKARMAGDSSEAKKQLEDLLKYCVEGVKDLSKDRGVLLLFDTAEQFVYPGQNVQRFAPAWDWLRKWVTELRRGVVIFAGRPEGINKLAQSMQQEIQGMQQEIQVPFIRRKLNFFTLEESREYIQRVLQRYRTTSTGSLIQFSEETIQQLHDASRGRPILLTLCLEIFQQNREVFEERIAKQRNQNFEQEIINLLLSNPDWGETLKAAGRVPRGLSVALLAKIRGIPHCDAEQELEQLKTMSFAKVFPDDDRLFLHDEMYGLLQKYVYLGDQDTADAAKAAQNIYEYYRDQLKEKDEQINSWYSKLLQEPEKKQTDRLSVGIVEQIHLLEEERQRLKTEMVYYRLRYKVSKDNRPAKEDDPIGAGLRRCYRYGHEAATSSNESLLRLLQNELVRFWVELGDEDYWKPFIEGMLLITETWIWVATGQNDPDNPSYQSFFEKLENIHHLEAQQKAVLQALLNTWRGTGVIFSAKHDYQRARDLLTKAIEQLSGMTEIDQRLQWFKNAAISLAYRQRGYLYTYHGAPHHAIQDYLAGLQWGRSLNFLHEEATLRSDLGFAQMMNGQFLAAMENMQEGLRLRQRVAIGTRLALSYNILSQCFLESGAYEESQVYARQAIRIAEAIGFSRGLGAGYYHLAEALRRLAFSERRVREPLEYLQEAQEAIDHAVKLFEKLDEQNYIVATKLEQACIYRDRVRLPDEEVSKRKSWFEKAEKQLREVADKAKELEIPYRQADAMSNRIWLGYYMGDFEFAEQAAQEFEKLEVLRPYWFKNGKFEDESTAQNAPQLWVQIGRYYAAKGMIALEKWRRSKEDSQLRDAAKFFTLAVMYNTKFAHDHRGLREGRRTIRQALTQLNDTELKQFCQYVKDTKEEENIPQELRQFEKMLREHALWLAE